ncbi:MAG TPA: hypothetical protein VK590_02310, partial [Saprospiraceae bacterium]|nr:hypothetical protein [Saprospiraceae bacterium]
MKKPIYLFIILSIFFASCKNENPIKSNIPEMKKTEDSIAFISGYSDVNGIKMYYELHGNKGDYLVLIHGGGSTIGTTFSKILPLLAKNYK